MPEDSVGEQGARRASGTLHDIARVRRFIWRRRAPGLLGTLLVAWLSIPFSPALAEEPLPIDVVLSLRQHNGRSPINISADGQWVAHTIEATEKVMRGVSRAYADTGFPFADGNSRMEATLDALKGDETIRLGAPHASSWSPVWSPDGQHVAFYSDQDGEAGLWIWDRSNREARRLGRFVARPFFGFDGARWSPDGQHILVKILPEGLTLAEANALLPLPQQDSEAEPFDPEKASVSVRRSTAMDADDASREDAAPPGDFQLAPLIRGLASDLAIVDVGSGEVQRIFAGKAIRQASFSPDGRTVAFTVQDSFVANAEQGVYDLCVHDVATGEVRVLATDVFLGYGIEWSWSPDARQLAYIESGQLADGGLVLIDVATGQQRRTRAGPSFDPYRGNVTPSWSPDSKTLLVIGEGSLWAIDAPTGRARRSSSLEGWQMRAVLQPSWYAHRFATPDGGRTALVTAKERGGARQEGLFSVEIATGATRALHEEQGSWNLVFSLASSGDEAIYVARNQHQVGELWAVATAGDRAPRQVSRINERLATYPLGEARILEFESATGEALKGTLLLPPNYDEGERLPTVVWVYGGARGSESLHRFGLRDGPTFNMHLLATRGYAVFFPDAPLETGRVTESLVATVLPGVEAAIEQGFADRNRLAIMGQSYGSINVLALLTKTELFSAAVISAAILHPDLATDYLRSTGYYEKGQGNMGGTLWEHPERYRSNSPLFDFPQISTPLLIGQGDQDGDLVPSEAIFTGLERLGKKVEYRLYRGEEHVITRPANVRDFWERRLEFLAEHLDLEVDASGRVTAR